MPGPRSRRRARLAALVSAALAVTGFQLLAAAPAAHASVSAKISTFPYTQDWSTLTTTSTWADFPGVEGFTTGTTIAAANQPNTTDVGTLTAEGTLTSSLVARTGTALPNTDSNGGVLTYGAATDKTVALSATGTLTTPLLVFHLDTTGKSGVGFAYDIQDLDSSTDDQPTRVALQYRAGTSGAYTNIPGAYVADATVVSNTTVVSTHVSATLPAAADNQSDVYVRVITLDNASGSNEHIGIDNINITANSGPAPLALASVPNKTGVVDQAITGFSFSASGGTTPYTYSATGLPSGVSVDPSTGAVSGTPTAACTCSVTAKVTDGVATEATQPFTFTVSSLAVTNPGNKTFVKDEAITPFSIQSTGGTPPLSYTVTGGSLPTGLTLGAGTGEISGTPTATQAATSVTVTVTDADSNTASTTFSIAVAEVTPIATVQGTGARSPFAPATNATSSTPANGQTVTTQGVVTAVYTKGYAASGAASCGFCGFYLQTGGTGGADGTPGASDAIFVFTSGFTGKDSASNDIAIGQSLRVTGTVSEFSSASDPATESVTEITATRANTNPIAALAPVTAQTTLPTTYADREAHEGELFKPTDLVITDTFNFESFGELGLSSGDKTLQQPNEACIATNLTCIQDAQTDIKNRGWFVEDGTSTTFASGAALFRPKNSNNSDIPLPYIDKTHSARVGAHVAYPQGGVLDFRNRKWYVQVPRAVSAAPEGAPDLGTDVLSIEDTRPANEHPADVLHGTGDLKIATYNVENFFTTTGKAFAEANPYISDQTGGKKGCEWDYDRFDNPILTFQCTSPSGTPDAWDPVTNVPTHYHASLTNAPRGAYDQASLDRQTAKIVTAINGLDADVVSLEELENPNKLRMGITNGPLDPDLNNTKDQGQGTPIAWRDESIAYLVDHLNAAAPAGTTWSFVASPAEATDATSVNHMCATKNARGDNIQPTATAGTCSWASGQDVIRSGFLYNKQTIVPVGQSNLDLPGLNGAPVPSPFDNAREPLAQFFKPVGHPNADGFAVIVNHFKSKGDADSGDGGGPATGDNANDPLYGAFNGDRTRQAGELLRFANWFAGKWDTNRVFLVGDFNVYTGEPPVQTIINDPNNVDSLDFTELHSDDVNDTTYDFTTTVDGIGYGGTGSLDHVFASAGALSMVTGRDTWEINANEPGAYNYSRYHTNATDFWDPTVPFAGSDHNPFIIGIKAPDTGSVRDVQIIGANDFHGRLLGDASDGGAAQMAGAVKSLKNTYGNGNSVFVSAGDNVGASIFESFTAEDKPTIDALNAAGLEYSSIGNHEFDKGWHDLVDRITNPADPHGGAAWQYLGANVVHDGGANDGQPIVAPWAVKDFGDTGVGGDIKVGFIGGVTNDLPGLVSPSSLNGVKVNQLLASVNAAAADLKAAHPDVDLIILLAHEGAANTDCDSMLGAGNAYATLLNGLAPSIDAVLSGHTHLEYSCSFPVSAWAGDSSHPIKDRPVMQAASYGLALDQLVYEFDSSGKPVSVVQNNVNVKGAVSTLFNYPEDPAVKTIVDDAVTAAQGPGAVVLGQITGPFKRARLADGATENRGGESTLGNQIAEMQRWATADAQHGSAQIAFMNPGGLRADLIGTPNGPVNDVNYRQAADVQPFANELINKQMTGAQIRAVLEQQWQRDSSGNVPSRPFLRLGTSAGFTYTYNETDDPAHAGAKLGHVTAMYLNGVKLDDATTYSVTMNGFLADGGDNFTAFTAGTGAKDTALSDLDAQVAYMKANATQAHPLAVSYAQHAVQVTFPAGAPAAYAPGGTVQFDVASLAMTAVGDVKDDNITVKLGDQVLGTFPVDNTMTAARPYDDTGKASVSVTLPAGLTEGSAVLHLVGDHTGTDAAVAIPVDDGLPNPSVSADDAEVPVGQDAHVTVTVDPAEADGTVGIYDGATQLGSDAPLAAGSATVTIPAAQLPAIGDHELTLTYSGETGAYSPSTDTFTLTVTRASSTVSAADTSVVFGAEKTVAVQVAATGVTPTGSVTIKNGSTTVGTGTLTNGTASVTLAAQSVPVGTHTLSVEYAGDPNVSGSSGSFVLTVTKATATVTAPDVTVPVGGTGTATVTVTAPGVTPTGNVTLKNGATTIGSGALASGHVSISLPALPDGTVVTVEYAGDGNVNAGTGSFVVHKGAKAAATVTVPNASVVYGNATTVTVHVATAASGVTPTGTVTIREGATTFGTGTVSGGVATITLAARSLAVGVHTLSAEYSGDANLNGAATTFSVSVSKAGSTTDVTVKPKHPKAGHRVKLKITVDAANGVEVTGRVSIKLDGDVIAGVLKNGTFTTKSGKLAKGTYHAKVTYLGDANVEGSTATVKIQVS